VDSKDSGSWGFGVGVNASDNAEVGFLFGQQLSTLEISGTTTVVGVLVERGASSGALAPIFAQLPPCTEGVHWIVLKNPITVSSEDLAQYHERIHFNARPVQRFAR
jgi:Eukaryotic-type carbonic anhydrase